MFKNRANQGVYVFAYDTVNNTAKTDSAASITAVISKDGAANASVSDTNPTEIGNGVYWFDLTQAETNADSLAVTPVFTSDRIQLDVVSVSTGISADVTQISGDTSAANNLESMYDGTGYTASTAPSNVATLDTVNSETNDNNDILNDPTYGNEALASAINNITVTGSSPGLR